MFGINDMRAESVARRKAGRAEAVPGEAFRTTGLVGGTRIATEMGWRPVEAVAVGDLVLTFDNGLQPVVAVTRTPVETPSRPSFFNTPIRVPVGALGNAKSMILLPDQSVVVESDAAEDLFGDPFAALKARDLFGLAGIDHADPADVREVVTLHFAEDQVLHADGGALIVATADIPGETTLAFLTHARTPAPYATYDGQAARMIVSRMAQPDARLGEGGLMRPAA